MALLRDSQFLAQVIRRLTRVLATLVVLFLLPSPAHANPVMWLKGQIYLTEHKLLYRKPARLTSYCYWGPDDQRDTYRSDSTSCLHYPCALDMPFGGGACDLVIETIEGEKIVFSRFLDDESIPSNVLSKGLWREFEATIDIGARTYESGKPESSEARVNSFQTLFSIALLLTLIVESSSLLALKYALKLNSAKIRRVLLAGTIASLVTLPCVWFLLPVVWSGLPLNSYTYCIAVAELLVVIVEAGLYYWILKVSARHAILLSFVANAISFLIGALLL